MVSRSERTHRSAFGRMRYLAGYFAGWSDAKKGRDYGDGREEDGVTPRICGVVSHSGPNFEPLACGYRLGHVGPHAWSTLPTVTEAGGSL